MKSVEVVVYVRGGMVEAVWSSDENVHLTIYDQDNIDCGDEPPCDLDWVEKNLTAIW